MLTRLKRIKRILELSKINGIEKADRIYWDKGSNTHTVVKAVEKIGNGQAVFFGEGTEEEWKDEQNERKGFKGIFGL